MIYRDKKERERERKGERKKLIKKESQMQKINRLDHQRF